jgi:hypothetical protein
MFEKVGEPSLSPFLVLGTDMIPEVDGDDRERALSAGDHVDPVGQRCLLETERLETEGRIHRSGRFHGEKRRSIVTKLTYPK